VEFVVNASYSTVLDWLSRASIGLSTMVDEHFGINIVEFMVRFQQIHSIGYPELYAHQAAGVIPLAHKSGGPLVDIIVPFEGLPTGQLFIIPIIFVSTCFLSIA